MGRLRNLLIKVAVVVLGLAPILQAQETTPSNGPQFCPPLDQFLTPTLLDVLLYPGITFN